MLNPAAIQQLPAAQQRYAYAKLTTAEGKLIYDFMYNPEELGNSRSATYAPGGVAVVAAQPLEWTGSEGKNHRIPDLLMDSHGHGKSLQPAIDAIYGLLDPVTGTLNPPVMYFEWGKRRIGPARLKEVSITETGWLEGAPAIARCSLTLQEIPTATPTATAATPSTAVALTDRQQEEAKGRAKSWLEGNLSSVIPSVREAFQAGPAGFVATSGGAVTLLRQAKAVAVVGNWDGFTFQPAEAIQQN
jgi:hypothetical protein